jgi:hypothetical protein
MLDTDALQEYMSQVRDLEQGPIVLVGSSLLERKRDAALAAMQKYFDQTRRRIWSIAFRKAAYFLGRSAVATDALRLSAVFADASVPAESIEAAQVLFDRAVQYVQQVEQARAREEKQTSLIMTPDEFARQARSREKP